MNRAVLSTEAVRQRCGAPCDASLGHSTPAWPSVARVILLELDGASYGLLVPLAESGLMPNLAEWMRSAALARLDPLEPCAEAALCTTLHAGAGPEVHGVLDNCFLDHRRGVVRSTASVHPCAMLADVVSAADPRAGAIRMAGTPAADIWRRRPASLDELGRGIAWMKDQLDRMIQHALRADASGDWRLLALHSDLLDPLQHRLWNVLGLAPSPGGQPAWIAKTREFFVALDRALGEIMRLAERRQAALMIVSPYGLGPMEEKISLGEVLRRRGLLQPGSATVAALHRCRRWLDKLRVWPWWVGAAVGRFPSSPPLPAALPLGKIVPLDWRRSRAVCLHGETAGFIYLNTPQRFGSRLLRTRRQRDQAATEVLWSLQEAIHPVTGQPLFAEAFLTAERYGHDPLERLWPDIVAIPAPGFQARPGLDRNRQILRADPSNLGAHRPGGIWMAAFPGARTGESHQAGLHDVAPTILKLLGLWPPRTMTGRPAATLIGE